jgi:hypothetical protein
MAVTLNASASAGLVATADTSTILQLQTGGTTAVTVDASQNVGIGTASPGVKLEVNGATSIFGAAGTAAGLTALTVGDATNATFRMAFTNGTVIQLATNATVALAFGTKETSAGTFTERVRIPAAGGFQSVGSISVGNATPTTSGAGITFPATQSASSDANTLDDYEEGTWTPSLGGTATYDIRTGTYTKVGNVVTITGSIRPSSLGTGSANTLTGLPFSTAGDGFGGIEFGDGWAVSVYSVHLYLSGTSLEVRGFTAAATAPAVINLFQSNARIYFTATYLTS